MVRKPLQRVSNGSAIDDAGAESAHAVPKIESAYRLRVTGSDPAQSYHERAHTQHESGTDPIHQVPLERYEPSFKGDE